MAYQASGALATAAINSERLAYYFYQFIDALSPAHIVIVDSDPGGGDFLSETGPGDGAYIVIESAYTVGGVKWQAILGFRSTAGAIGGYAGPYQGAYVGWAPDGGWDSVSETFGAALFSGLKKVDALGSANMGPFNFEMAVVEKLVGTTIVDAALVFFGDNNKDGTWDSGFYVGAFYNAVSTVTKQSCLLTGGPNWASGAANWGATAGTNGACWNSAVAALELLRVDNMNHVNWVSSWFLTDDSGEPFSIPIQVYNESTNRVKGWLCYIARTDDTIADGTKNAAGTYIIYNGLVFPSA